MATFMNTRTFFQAQTKIVTDIYSNTDPMKPLRWPTLFNAYEGDIERAFFQTLSIVGFGLMPTRQEGQTAAIDAAKEGRLQMFPYVTYALRYIVSKEMAREDTRRMIPMLPRLLRYASYQTQENNFWNILNLSFTAASAGGYNVDDGNPLCYGTHTIAGTPGTTFSNFLGPVSLTVETLQQSFTLLANMPDDRGLVTSRTPEGLVYPLGLHQTAVEVLASFYYPTSDENKVNVVAGTLQPHAVEYLTSPASGPFPWWVVGHKAMLGADGHSMFAAVKWDEQRSWVDQNVLSLNHETEFRAAWGAVTPRGVVGSQGA